MATEQSNTVEVRGLSKHPLLWDTNVSVTADDQMGTVQTSVDLYLAEVDGNGKPTGKEQKLSLWGGKPPSYVKVDGKYTIHPDLNDFIRMLVSNYVTPHNTRKGKGYSLCIGMNAKRFTKEIEVLISRKARVEALTTINPAKIGKVAATVEQLYQFALLHAAVLSSINKRWPPEEGEEEKSITGEAVPQAEVAFSL